MRILLVEDDRYIAEMLATTLADQNYHVDLATDGIIAWQKTQSSSYDLIILDVGLPQLDGISLCKKLRSHQITTPILLLTACDQREDKVKGFEAGADDYVVKPFDMQELTARIKAMLRRHQQTPSAILEWENLRLNTDTCEVTYQDKVLNLTPKEYGLLELFLQHHQRVFSLDNILDQLWTYEDPPSENTVRAHIKGLRQKLKIAGAPGDLIETVYGLGYRLKQLSAQKKASQPLANKTSQIKPEFHQAITQIWERYKDKICDRITVLEQVSTAIQQGKLNSQLRQQGQQEAHKLAGSLGTFGLSKGSVLAREIEHLFQHSSSFTAEETLHYHQLVVKLRYEVERNNNHLPLSTSPQNFSEPASVKLNSSRQLWIISSDQSLIQMATSTALKLKLVPHAIADLSFLEEMRHRLPETQTPPIVLLDFDFNFSDRLLTELTQNPPFLPVIVLTQQKDFTQRVKVAKSGGRAFLEKPITAEEIAQAVSNILRQSDKMNTKVLIVDDEPVILDTLQALLKPWGIQTFTLNDPRQFWEILESTTPDLLILDIEMPYLDGIELCRVVRTDPRWNSLPVIFLSAHSNEMIQHQVFTVGADDYLTKPIEESTVVNRILNRLRRTQSLRDFQS